MKILALHRNIRRYLKKKGLEKIFKKQIAFFEKNQFHPSLKTELLEPKEMHIWSFRVGRKYRAIFIFRDGSTIEILDVNNHYV